jgi:hypothetical protein
MVSQFAFLAGMPSDCSTPLLAFPRPFWLTVTSSLFNIEEDVEDERDVSAVDGTIESASSQLISSTGVPARDENVVEELSLTEMEHASSSAIALSSENTLGQARPKLWATIDGSRTNRGLLIECVELVVEKMESGEDERGYPPVGEPSCP